MKDYYVQLTSNASTTEFPANTPHHFKNRMPYPLQFREPGWSVGLASVSFPEAPRKIPLNDTFLFRFGWIESVDPLATVYAEEMKTIRVADLQAPPKTGTEFFNAVRDVYLRRMFDESGNDVEYFKKKRSADDPTELTYMTMARAKEGVGVIDNSQTCTTIEINNSPRYPKLFIGLDLAKAMKWVEMGIGDDGQPQYVLGPNLRKDFPNHVVPEARDVLVPVNNGDEMFYQVTADALQLSAHINWVFMDLEGAFERAFGSNRRPLYVYSNAMRSMVVGNQVTDLMREVPYALDQRHFAPDPVQYRPVRSDVMDIFETQVAENDGTLVNFVPGVTTVTLHFKYE